VAAAGDDAAAEPVAATGDPGAGPTAL
jgi:hypothetical protein